MLFRSGHYLRTADGKAIGVGAHAPERPPLPAATWYHVVGVVDRETRVVRCYMNGALRGEAKDFPDLKTFDYQGEPWRIGIGGPESTHMYRYQMFGLIADVRFYDRALSIEEAQLLAGISEAPRSKSAPAILERTLPSPAPNVNAPPERDLLGRWSFDEEGGVETFDVSGKGNHGKRIGEAAPSPDVAPVTFKNLRSLSLDSRKVQGVEVPDAPSLNPTGSFSLAAWIRCAGLTSAQQSVIDKWDWTGEVARGGYFMRLSKDGSLHCLVPREDPGPNEYLSTPRKVPIGEWAHIAATFDAPSGAMRLYINGADVGGGGGVRSPAPCKSSFQIGGMSGANRFNGLIDDVRMYGRALSAASTRVTRIGIRVPAGMLAKTSSVPSCSRTATLPAPPT